MDKALDKFKASEIEWKERRQVLYKQIKDIDVEIERLVAAISAGGDIPVLVTAVKATNERRTALSSDLAEADSQHRSDADYDQLKKDLKAHFETFMANDPQPPSGPYPPNPPQALQRRPSCL